MTESAFSAKISGLKDATDTFGELKKRTQSTVIKRALAPAAELIREEAERLAPHDPTPDGMAHLNEEIEVTLRVRKGQVEARVGFTEDAFWGQFQELGTEDHAPQPFLRPAMDTKEREAVQVFGEAMRDEVNKSVKRSRARRG